LLFYPPPARGGEILGDPKFPPPGWGRVRVGVLIT